MVLMRISHQGKVAGKTDKCSARAKIAACFSHCVNIRY